MCGLQFINRYGTGIAELQGRAAGGTDTLDADAVGCELLPRAFSNSDEVAALILAEEGGESGARCRLIDGGADAGCHRHFGERDGKTAVREVVCGGRNAVGDQLADEIADLALVGEINMRGRAF